MKESKNHKTKNEKSVLLNGKPNEFSSEEELLGFLFYLNESSKSFYENSAETTSKDVLKTYYWDIADTKEDIRIDLTRFLKLRGFQKAAAQQKHDYYVNPFGIISDGNNFDELLEAEKRLLNYYQEALKTSVSQDAKERIELYAVLERNIVAELERAKKDHS